MTKPLFQRPRGTQDLSGAVLSRFRRAQEIIRGVMAVWGYEEIQTPCYEDLALFVRSLGDESEVVRKQILRVISGENEESASVWALRPEGTAAVVRAYIEHRLDQTAAVQKLFYIGPMFRGERPQKGRLRQFHQAGVEVIGPQTASPWLDAEVIALAVEVLERCGMGQLDIALNTLGTPEDQQKAARLLKEHLASHADDLCPDCRARLERNVLRVLDCKRAGCRSAARAGALRTGEVLSDASRSYFDEVRRGLDALGLEHRHDPCLVRGLDYYTHTVFEITAPGLGAQDAVAAGGRYDRLVSQLGGPEADAVGFAIGLERMLLASTLEARESERPFVWIVQEEAAWPDVAVWMRSLRRDGVATDAVYKDASLKALLRIANKRKAWAVAIIGSAEWGAKRFNIRLMDTGEEHGFSWDQQEGWRQWIKDHRP